MYRPALLGRRILLSLLPAAVVLAAGRPLAAGAAPLRWDLVNADADWAARAGLQVLAIDDDFYLMGGRTPRPPSFPPIPGDSDIWGDVWKSTDRGESWTRILETDDANHWPARAYFQAVNKRDRMFVLGGQNFLVVPDPDCPPPYIDCLPFLPVSEFFNDVWASDDGVEWRQMTDDAGWSERAGLSSVVFNGEIYVFGGSYLDDPSIVGGPPVREYYNDVWKSKGGREWVQLTESAPWEPRAGATAAVKDGYIWLLGGENGFLCEPFPGCELPYFNDVWRTRDGVEWELVTESAGWSPRPGHQCVVARNQLVCFGGFGLPVNPMDVWISDDGADWEQVSRSPWNAVSPDEIKYDFDVLVVENRRDGRRPSIFTFGGDRETFDFTDPFNYLRIDNDVWSFTPGGSAPARPIGTGLEVPEAGAPRIVPAAPNPFAGGTALAFSVPQGGPVTVSIYDARGRAVRRLVTGDYAAGEHRIAWDGLDDGGTSVAAGVYFARVQSDGRTDMTRLVRLK